MSNFSIDDTLLADPQGRIPGDPNYNTGAVGDDVPLYQQVETEIGRVANADGTYTVSWRSAGPSFTEYTTIEGTPNTSPLPPKDPPPADPTKSTFVPATDARNTINATLNTYGLSSLGEFLYGLYAKELVNINNPDAIIYAVRDQPAYKTRFAANESRLKAGLSELSPGTYVALENAYRQQLQANGLPEGFYDSTDDFKQLLENDVSPAELQERITNGFNAIDSGDPETLKQLKEFYPEVGNSREALAAYFLDPAKAVPVLTRQAQAAKVAARGKEQGGVQLGRLTAEELASRGYSAGEIESAFGLFSQQKGLLDEMVGEESLTQGQKVGATFGYDPTSADALKKRKSGRKAVFEGGGGFVQTAGKRAGTIETGAGEAQ